MLVLVLPLKPLAYKELNDIENRYYFTDLEKVKGSWKHTESGQLLASGDLKMSVKPHEIQMIEISTSKKLSREKYNLLHLKFIDQYGVNLNEHVIRVLPKQIESPKEIAYASISLEELSGKGLKCKNGGVLKMTDRGKLQLKKENKLFWTGPYINTGRKLNMSEKYSSEWHKGERSYWPQVLMMNPSVFSLEEENNQITLHYTFDRPDSTNQKILLDIIIRKSIEGEFILDYTINTINATDYFIELGISFHLPSADEVQWRGSGPHPNYPLKDRSANPGYYTLKSAFATKKGSKSCRSIQYLATSSCFIATCGE